MGQAELTREEKAKLLGLIDQDIKDFDRCFYEALCQIQPPRPEEIEGKYRRAVLQFIANGQGEASKRPHLIMMAFLHGFVVGAKLRVDICKKQPELMP